MEELDKMIAKIHTDPTLRKYLQRKCRPKVKYVKKTKTTYPLPAITNLGTMLAGHVEYCYDGTTMHIKDIVDAVYNLCGKWYPQTYVKAQLRAIGHTPTTKKQYTIKWKI